MPPSSKLDEATWLTATSFLTFFQEAGTSLKSRRKKRLFCVACCRRLGDQLTDPRCLVALVAAERYADGEMDKGGLKAVRKEAVAAARAARPSKPGAHEWSPAEAVQMAVSENQTEVFVTGPIRVAITVNWMRIRSRKEEDAVQIALLRDIFGNPFRPVTFSEQWRTDTALSLARQMYESREFSAMPILAYALQDAGCDNEDILSHCRDAKQTHVRGCWVVDFVLGKN